LNQEYIGSPITEIVRRPGERRQGYVSTAALWRRRAQVLEHAVDAALFPTVTPQIRVPTDRWSAPDMRPQNNPLEDYDGFNFFT
jgi:hypothetical protein